MSTIFSQLKAGKQVFRRKHLPIYELASQAQGLMSARNNGHPVDCFLSKATRTRCVKAICSFMRYHKLTARIFAKPLSCAFGFDYISWRQPGQTINLICAPEFTTDGMLWMVDGSQLRAKGNDYIVKHPDRHAIIYGVKQFIANDH